MNPQIKLLITLVDQWRVHAERLRQTAHSAYEDPASSVKDLELALYAGQRATAQANAIEACASDLEAFLRTQEPFS